MNLININDFFVLFERIKLFGMKVLLNLLRKNDKRVSNAWSDEKSNVSSWWQISEVQQRLRHKITGNENLSLVNYVSEKYINQNIESTGISLGCGMGAKEIEWVRSNKNLKLSATDVSEHRIKIAKENLPIEFYQRLDFFIADVNKINFENQLFDIVISDSALHHFSPLENVVKNIAKSLKRDGIFVVNEYVGPSRFQWNKTQLHYDNEILQTLPEKYRIKRNGAIKRKIYRSGIISMYLSDPSEAAESGKISNLLNKHFKVVEKKECGGGLLHLLLKDISHNFVDKSDETCELLNKLFAKEDDLMNLGELKSDFTFFVLRVK